MRQLAITLAVLGSAIAHVVVLAVLRPDPAPVGTGAEFVLQLKTHLAQEPVHAPLALDDAEQKQAGVRQTAPVTAARTPQARDGAVEFWPPNYLERQPVPVSAPDTRSLTGRVVPSGLVRLRLFIDATGQVSKVSLQGAQEADWSPLQRMFEATRFIPGRRGGQDVASWVEIEVNVSDLVRVL